jgi:lipid-binding SYLF domain-containing protein
MSRVRIVATNDAEVRRQRQRSDTAVKPAQPPDGFAMIKRTFLSATLSAVSLVIAGCATESPTDRGAKRRSIDANVDLALANLFEKTKGSKELVRQAKGVLVFPDVISAGLVIGGSHGDGALRMGTGVVGYYSTSTASIGLLAGAQSKAVFVLFLTDDALSRFRASDGWTAGADASIAAVSVSASGAIDTQTVRAPVVGFVLSNGGLMAELSLEGTKVRKLDL